MEEILADSNIKEKNLEDKYSIEFLPFGKEFIS